MAPLWKLTEERISEVIRLNAKTPKERLACGWQQIDIGDHMAAVLVFGETQEIAEVRAAAIVAAMNLALKGGL